MTTLRDMYRNQQKTAKVVKPVVAAPTLTAQQVLAASPALPDERESRAEAFHIAQCIQSAKPHKVVVVFNIFGHRRWFVRSFNEVELRRFLADCKQVKTRQHKGATP